MPDMIAVGIEVALQVSLYTHHGTQFPEQARQAADAQVPPDIAHTRPHAVIVRVHRREPTVDESDRDRPCVWAK